MIDPATAPSPAGAASAAALERYGAAVRRRRVRYLAVLTAIVVVLAVLVTVAWSRGEIANTSLHTVSRAPAPLALSSPSATPELAWRTTDRAASGNPQWLGTVVVYSKHTVRGLNARTGAATWSYTRSNRTTCTAIQTGGTTFALFQVNGNCDQLTALDSGTGARRWTRTLDEDGKPLNGVPDIAVRTSTVLFTTPTVIYAIDPGSGIDRWTYAVPGCTIARAVLGSAGALISQTCTTPRCGSVKFCRKGPQLFLRDGTLGRDDKSQTNPDHVIWATNGATSIPVSADEVVSSLDPAVGRLNILSGATGAASDEIPVAAQRGSPDSVALAAEGTEIVYLGGVIYAVTPGRSTPLWSQSASGPPSLVDALGEETPPLTTARLTVATQRGIVELDGSTGQLLRTAAVSGVPAGAAIRPMGTGYLVASTAGTTAYH